jgi:hypothetical protein
MTRKNYLVAITLITIIAVIQSCKKDEAPPPPPTTLALNIKDSIGNAVSGATVKLYTSKSDLRMQKNQVGETLIADAEGKVKVSGINNLKYYWFVEMGCQNNSNGMLTSASDLVSNTDNSFDVAIQPTGTLAFANRSTDPYKIFVDGIEYMQLPGHTIIYFDEMPLASYSIKVVQVVRNQIYPAEETFSGTLSSCGSSIEFHFPAY